MINLFYFFLFCMDQGIKSLSLMDQSIKGLNLAVKED